MSILVFLSIPESRVIYHVTRDACDISRDTCDISRDTCDISRDTCDIFRRGKTGIPFVT